MKIEKLSIVVPKNLEVDLKILPLQVTGKTKDSSFFIDERINYTYRYKPKEEEVILREDGNINIYVHPGVSNLLLRGQMNRNSSVLLTNLKLDSLETVGFYHFDGKDLQVGELLLDTKTKELKLENVIYKRIGSV